MREQTCIPGVGITLVNHLSKPVILNMNTHTATKKPAETVSAMVKCLDIATAAMAFIGWTGSGMPNTTPVRIFHSPENTRVVESDIELLTARAIMSGRRVPKSPKDPDISERGFLRNVEMLFACIRRMLEKGMVLGRY